MILWCHQCRRSTGISVRPITVRVPPPPSQRKIAAILSAYDDLIEVNTRRIALLEEMARGLYREWFVRFRFPGHEGVRMVESAVGLVPEGWEVKTLGDVVELAYGKRPHRRTPDCQDTVPSLRLSGGCRVSQRKPA